MSISSNKAQQALAILNSVKDISLLIDFIRANKEIESDARRFPIETKPTVEGLQKRISILTDISKNPMDIISGETKIEDYSQFEGNIENMIGFTQVPTGVIGPLRVLGSAAQGDYYVPLATTEGALVSSYDRGAKASRMAGGITSICLTESVQRSPVFKFKNVLDLGTFLVWILQNLEPIMAIPSNHSRFAKLMDVKPNVEGNQLILTFDYQTGDASGQNMITICTDEICKYIIAEAPIKPEFWFIESNYSGDKKATALTFTNVRGKKVTAEVNLSEEIVRRILRTTPKAMADYWQSSTIGVIQSGAIGAQGHVANGLCALFMATGQDVACVAEAAVGITRMEVTEDNGLYACVTLPGLIVGTVGGGTGLPSQRQCLELMDCYGEGKARKFAEICGAVALAGELSIAAALSAGHFTQAHKKFGRKKS